MSQQDFWGSFEGTVDGSEAAANVEQSNFDSINGGTFAPAIATQIELTNNQGAVDAAVTGGYEVPKLEQYYNVKWQVVGGDYKDRVVFQKIKPFQEDKKKATRQANVLRRLMTLTGCQIGQGAPQEADLVPALNKPLFIGIALWENLNQRTGEWGNGNWISHINPATAGVEPVTGDQAPKHAQGEIDQSWLAKQGGASLTSGAQTGGAQGGAAQGGAAQPDW